MSPNIYYNLYDSELFDVLLIKGVISYNLRFTKFIFFINIIL